MCGIFAYIGERQVLSVLLTALKRLEYRGYDSAGVGIHSKPLKIKKKVGKVSNLEAECAHAHGELDGTMGIAHVRWATHGKPSDANAHPHTSQDGTIAVVHNGVIENYRALKEQLSKKGHSFTSETDTELLCHLVQDLHREMPAASWSQVVATTLMLVEGAYGVVFLFSDEPDLLIGARKGSPLILGVGVGENMLASDASAVIEYTQDVVYLNDGQLVEVRKNSYAVHETLEVSRSMDFGSPRHPDVVRNPVVRIEMTLEELEKGGYPHFMLKEIMDQPNALRNALRGRIYSGATKMAEGSKEDAPGPLQIKLGGLEKPLDGREHTTALDLMANAKRIIVVACGTSWHSALIGKYAVESLAHLPVEVEYASEFRYRRPLISEDDVVVAISQSGETADTLEAVKMAKQHKALTIGVVNVVGSSIARCTDAGVFLHAGPEIGVASTKAFTCQVVTLLMIALHLAFRRKAMSIEELDAACKQLNAVPQLIEDWLEPLSRHVKVIAKCLRLASNALFAGCGIQFPVALEGALKLKEISYLHAEGFPASEIRHAPRTLVSSFMPVVFIAMKSDPAYEQIQANIRELRQANAALIVLTDEGNEDLDKCAHFVIHVPSTKLEFKPLLTVIPLQFLSYYIADMRGCNIDQPRNLAKSVTVE